MESHTLSPCRLGAKTGVGPGRLTALCFSASVRCISKILTKNHFLSKFQLGKFDLFGSSSNKAKAAGI